jgi:hypothetical protein
MGSREGEGEVAWFNNSVWSMLERCFNPSTCNKILCNN